jgi:hypothetical protein
LCGTKTKKTETRIYLDADEEAGEIRESAGAVESYADGFTWDELATVIREADRQPESITKSAVKVLRGLSQTDMFEQLVSSDEGRAMRIAAVLDRSEQSMASQSEDAADDGNDSEYRNFDMTEYLS